MQNKLSMDELQTLAANFDHHSLEYRAHSNQILSHMHAHCPFAHSPLYDGFWVATKAKTVLEIAKNPEAFSSNPDIIPTLSPDKFIPLNTDPPLLYEYRSILNPVFAPNKMAAKLGLARQAAHRLIDAIVDRGQGDLVTEFSQPLTGIMTLDLLGIDTGQWYEYAHPVHEIVYSRRPLSERIAEMSIMVDMMKEEIRRQIKTPQGGMIEYLHNVQMSGRKLTLEEIDGIVLLVIAGGLDTTQAMVGSSCVFLGRNPNRREELINTPDLMDGAVEELLRMFAPNQGNSRVCVKDTMVDGHLIKTGEQIYMSWIGANLDPEEYKEPLEVDFRRESARNYTFGVGPHRCLGSHLARIEIKVCLEALLAKVPNFSLVEKGVEFADDVGTISGFRRVPVTV